MCDEHPPVIAITADDVGSFDGMTGEATSSLLRRYRRRIIGWGAGLLLIVFAIGSFVSLQRVEDDLTSRSSDELVALGVDGFTVEFSGQDAVVGCTAGRFAATETERIVDGLESLRGVRSVSIDAGCEPLATSTTQPALDEPTERAGGTAVAGDDRDLTVATENGDVDDAAAAAVDEQAADLVTVGELISTDPQFSAMMNAAAISGVDPFAVSSSLTVFAPTNEAFGALRPEVVGALNADPELMATVLAHHVLDGPILADELRRGELTMLDGTTIAVEGDATAERTLVSGGVRAAIADADLPAANGVVHAIDAVLLPADLDLGIDDPPAATSDPAPDPNAIVGATFVDGRLVLRGDVATDDQAAGLVGAATSALAATNVVDDALTIDASTPLEDGPAFGLAVLINTMVIEMAEGEAVVTADGLELRGTVVADTGAIDEAIDGLADVTVEIAARPIAVAADADAVEAQLLELVAAQPIAFDPSSAVPADGSAALFDRLAAVAKRFDGLVITVEGHTDSAGDADENLVLSEARADAVSAALIARGVPVEDVLSVGLGESEPVLVDGTEDPDASRRVVFAVALR